MASKSRDPTRDTGTGADITDIGSQRLRMARDLVADVAEAETEITAAVGKEAMVQIPTPPPNRYGQKTRGGGQNGREGGRLA